MWINAMKPTQEAAEQHLNVPAPTGAVYPGKQHANQRLFNLHTATPTGIQS
jgi:hypothetical protein